MQLDEGELRGSVDGHEQMKLAFGGPNLGNIDVEEADRIGLELCLRRFVALDVGKTADPVSLQAAMEG